MGTLIYYTFQDPLSRRLFLSEKKPPCEVQVVLLAENREVQRELYDAAEVDVQLTNEVDLMFSIQPASVLARILTRLVIIQNNFFNHLFSIYNL
jgi:hypothetical protein